MPEKETGVTAVLVVHGIGEQAPGETLRKLLTGLHRVEPGVLPDELGGGALTTVGGKQVRFYEVYWADLLRDENAKGAFQITELQSISWFPLFNLLRGNYRPGSYSFLRLLWWCVALPILNFFMLLAYYGSGVVVDWILRERHEAMEGPRNRTQLDRILDEYLGDVFSYVNSAGDGFYRSKGETSVPAKVEQVYPDILQRFYDQLLRASATCDSIQIVAHSLGTVVTYHALSGLRFPLDGRKDADAIRAATAKVRHLYTIGSPLEKIRFLWPTLTSAEAPLAKVQLQWDNFVSWCDPVAGVIKRFGSWAQVSNHHLLGGGFLSGHVVYERSQAFMDVFTQGLCGRALPFERTRQERRRDTLKLVGETALAPTFLVVVLVIGAAIFTLVILILPFLLSLPFRLFVPPTTWGPIVDKVALYLGSIVVFVFFLAPFLRAKEVHALYWASRRKVE